MSGLRIPTLVIWGESDRIVDAEFGRAYARAIPGAKFHVIPAAGHLPQLESPEALASLLVPFLEGGGR